VLLLDDEVLVFPVSCHICAFANAAYDGLTRSSHDFGVSPEERIRVLLVVIMNIILTSLNLRGLLRRFRVFQEIAALVAGDVHLVDQNAICWDSVSRLKVDEIASNELTD